MRRLPLAFLWSACLLSACTACEDATADATGEPIDYTATAAWAAHPDHADPADETPAVVDLSADRRALLGDRQSAARAHVFYVHPTTDWDLEAVRNAAIDKGSPAARVADTLRYQASAFNGAAKVWAPRYRQASLGTYVATQDAATTAVFERAYGDVRDAFDHFVASIGDAPFFVAGHSQGSAHLVRVLRERVDGKPLAARLIAAYIVGEFVGPDTFAALPVCATPTSTGCVVSWATARGGAKPTLACGSKQLSDCPGTPNTTQLPVTCVNPISWKPMDTAPASAHLGAGPGGGLFGGLSTGFSVGIVDARCGGRGVLRIDDTLRVDGFGAPDFDGVEDGDYHAQDYNLFYLDLRKNAVERAAAWR